MECEHIGIHKNVKFLTFRKMRRIQMEKKTNLTTLCYIEQNDRYLMMHRISKKNDLNEGKWVGVGGHFLEGESPEECLLREVKEETGLTLTSYRFRGIVTFVSDIWGCEYMHLYTADGFEQSAEEIRMEDCTEGVLEWIPKNQISGLRLWEGDKIFLKLLLEEQRFFSLKLVYEGDKLTDWQTEIY